MFLDTNDIYIYILALENPAVRSLQKMRVGVSVGISSLQSTDSHTHVQGESQFH